MVNDNHAHDCGTDYEMAELMSLIFLNREYITKILLD